jgi:Nif-specific regulatory protein
VQARITIHAGTAEEQTIEIGDEASIGRAPSNSIRINESRVSRHHARIETRGGQHVILNLGARNGLFVNGSPTDEAPLTDGDEIHLGNICLLYRAEGPARARPDANSPAVVLADGDGEGGLITADYTQLAAPSVAVADPAALAAAHRRLAAFHEVGLAITSILDPSKLRQRIAEVILEKLRAERCVIFRTGYEGELEVAAALSKRQRRETRDQIKIPRTILKLAHERGQAILSNDVNTDMRFEGSRSVAISGIASVLACPLVRPDRKLGVIYVDTLDRTRLFFDEDLRMLTAIASIAAIALENAQAFAATHAENRNLRAALGSQVELIGESEPVQRVLAAISKVAPTDTTILIRGETGTGKELVARAIHETSPRRTGPFIAVNCAALSESLLSSELFGHERGAFTGAHEQRAGKFEIADGGTLFLDEIGEVSTATQVKLLRVLQERTFERVGGVTPLRVDVRIIAATNRDLELAISEGTFRQDLYFRLRVFELELPPLRERRGDLPILAAHFLARSARRLGKPLRGFSPEALEMLANYPWPGNIRELQNAIERAAVMAEHEVLTASDLPSDLRENELLAELDRRIEAFDLALPEIIRWTEKTCIERALRRTSKKVELARLLQISRPTLDKKLREYQITLGS